MPKKQDIEKQIKELELLGSKKPMSFEHAKKMFKDRAMARTLRRMHGITKKARGGTFKGEF